MWLEQSEWEVGGSGGKAGGESREIMGEVIQGLVDLGRM